MQKIGKIWMNKDVDMENRRGLEDGNWSSVQQGCWISRRDQQVV